MTIAEFILELLRVLLSWPVVTAVLAIAAGKVFKSDLSLLMSRIARIRFPGGSDISMSQLERASENMSSDDKPDVPELEGGQPLPLPEGVDFSHEQLEAVRQLYFNERMNAYLWEYRYLNLFLAPNTQNVMDWIGSQTGPVSTSLYNSLWTPLIPSAQEREVIINVLQAHYLTAINNSLITITPKGQEYRDWRGSIASSKP
jgi:hypothetical protein